MEMAIPIVSVVIPSFNRGHCIKACIESVLTQSFQDFEVIVVDDASKDDTREQVASVADARVRYIAHETNQGGAAARNTGIRASHAEFIAFLDSDDRWVADKLQKQLTLLRAKGSGYGFVYSWFIARDLAGQEVERCEHSIDGLAVPCLIARNYIGTFSSVVARRSALDAVDGLDEGMRSCQDWDLFLRLNAVTGVCCVEEHLVVYLQNRSDRDRISANPTAIVLGHRRMLQKIERNFPNLSVKSRVESLKGFAGAFVLAGAVGDVLSTALSVLRLAPSLANIHFLFWNLARVLKRVVTRDIGY
jgi:glycosyltransferase involved in cell wall biosynthesis